MSPSPSVKKDMPQNNEKFEYHSLMSYEDIIKAELLLRSDLRFMGVTISQDAPLPAQKNPNGEAPVVISIPKYICLPDFWREFSKGLKDPLVSEVVQTALKLAGTQEERGKILARVLELKDSSPAWKK